MRFLRRFFIRLSNFATRTDAPTNACRKRSPNILPSRPKRTCAPACRPPRRGGRPQSSWARQQAIREDHHAEQSIPFIENLLFDLRYAVRMLLRSPGFSFIAIATMALGRRSHHRHLQRHRRHAAASFAIPQPQRTGATFRPTFPAWARTTSASPSPSGETFRTPGIFQYVSRSLFRRQRNLTGSAQPARIASKAVSPSYFAVLGVDAQLGRTFDPHDATPGYNLEVVISDGLWRRAFGADPHILGKTLRLDNDPVSCCRRHARQLSRPGPNQRAASVPNCGRRRDFPASRSAAACAARVSASRPSRALSLVSRLRPRRGASMPWLHR